MSTEAGGRTRSPAPVSHLTPAERAVVGKAARAAVPRASLGGFEAGAARQDPLEILEAQSAARIPELVPIRYGRMVASPFTFYRGAAAVMASDLSNGARTGLTVQLCGDAHLLNFGVYMAPDRRLIFSLNDFDETAPGPFEWDVKRLAASVEVAGRDIGLAAADRRHVDRHVASAYRTEMRRLATMRTLDVWYAREDVDELLDGLRDLARARRLRRLERSVDRWRTKDSLAAVAKLTTMVDGEPRFRSSPPLIVPVEELDPGDADGRIEQFVLGVIRTYRRSLQGNQRALLERFRYAHLARKVVGVGSVGTRAFVVLLLGRDGEDPLLLQVKEAQRSVLEPYAGRSAFSSSGQRVVEGQRLLQVASDIMLGWTRATGFDGVQRDYYVRQLWDGKGSVDVSTMRLDGLRFYAELCGRTLARAHARSGDAIAIAAYLGSSSEFDHAIGQFAQDYADQNEADHAALAAAVRAGRIAAREGV